eukprot:1299073-Amorphochlora_amoeboformis.AAC.2
MFLRRAGVPEVAKQKEGKGYQTTLRMDPLATPAALSLQSLAAPAHEPRAPSPSIAPQQIYEPRPPPWNRFIRIWTYIFRSGSGAKGVQLVAADQVA